MFALSECKHCVLLLCSVVIQFITIANYNLRCHIVDVTQHVILVSSTIPQQCGSINCVSMPHFCPVCVFVTLCIPILRLLHSCCHSVLIPQSAPPFPSIPCAGDPPPSGPCAGCRPPGWVPLWFRRVSGGDPCSAGTPGHCYTGTCAHHYSQPFLLHAARFTSAITLSTTQDHKESCGSQGCRGEIWDGVP